MLNLKPDLKCLINTQSPIINRGKRSTEPVSDKEYRCPVEITGRSILALRRGFYHYNKRGVTYRCFELIKLF